MAITFHHTRRGAFQEREDRWTLVTEPKGMVVEHAWSHFNTYTRQPDAGAATFGIDEFLAGGHSAEAKARLRKVLRKQDRAPAAPKAAGRKAAAGA
jgi:hypothetical protein